MSDTYRLQRRPANSAPTSSLVASASAVVPPRRLVSLDAYRGFIMSMLAAGGFGIGQFARLSKDSEVWKTWSYDRFQSLKFHFDHPAWQSITGWAGVSFWDLIQPAFMFMVGVAMPFSYRRREATGSSGVRRHIHAAVRASVLVLMGVFLYSLNNAQTNWVFTNVLAQIGLGYFFAYLCLGRSLQIQWAVFCAILVCYWGLFVMNPPPDNYDYESVDASFENGEVLSGRFSAWSKNANVAHFFDVWLLNKLRTPITSQDTSTENADSSSNQAAKAATDANADEVSGQQDAAFAVKQQPQSAKYSLVRQWWFSSPEPYTHNSGGYLTLNFIPSIATTLLGILCGQLLLGSGSERSKLLSLVVIGIACLLTGIAAHHTVCPIVKRIWTPGWVLFSGGYVVLMLAVFYLLFDVLPLRKLAFPLVVVGMNSIVMYMLGQMLRPWVTQHVVKTHFAGVLKSVFGADALSPDGIGAMVAPAATFFVFWLIAFWMYRHRYFVRV